MQTNNFLIVLSAKDENKARLFYFINGKRVNKTTFKLCDKLSINQRSRKENEKGYLIKLSYIGDIIEEIEE